MNNLDSNKFGYPFHSKSDRLDIRPLVQADWKDWIHFMNDDVAIKYFPAFRVEEAEKNAKNWINKQLDRYRNGQFGMLALIDRQSGEFVGQCGLLTQEVDGVLELEIGYSLIRKHWGKGYATEAAQFLKQWVFKQGITKTIISIIKTDNEDSKGVALKNGMIPSTELVWKDLDVVIYRVNNPSSDL